MDFLSKLGIDWKLLSAQIVQFVLLIFILRKLAYKPLLAMLEKRSKTIEKSLEDAKRIEQNLTQGQADRERMLAETRKEAESIVADARAAAETVKTKLLDETKQKMIAMRKQTETEAEAIKKKMLHDAQSQLADLVILASEHVVKAKLSDVQDRKLIEEALASVHVPSKEHDSSLGSARNLAPHTTGQGGAQ